MEILISSIFGLVQGITEFFPISSSGHLVILHRLFDLSITDEVAFDVALHFGTFVALCAAFWDDIVAILRHWVGRLFTAERFTQPQSRLGWQIILATVPVVIVGAFGSEAIAQRFRSVESVSVMLIAFAIFFILYERLSKQHKQMTELSTWSAIKIGLAQVLALVPGVSRSGVTIIAGLGEGLKRHEAARFSFLLSLPAVAAATLKKTADVAATGLVTSEIPVYIVGFVSAAVVGYLAVTFLIRFLERHTLHVFAYYRFALAAVLIAAQYLLWL